MLQSGNFHGFFSFQYGRINIEQSRKSKNFDDSDEDDEGYSEEICPLDKTDPELVSKCNSEPPNGLRKPNKNGYTQQNGNALISRDDKLILVPEPPTQRAEEEDAKGSDDENNSVRTARFCFGSWLIYVFVFQKKYEKYDFDLSNIFDYVKVGMEAIIEDQVTSRFEAEELKNWNLLIRTNTSYEFISWKLTVIWLCGFLIRYFFLLPIRVVICFVGVSIVLHVRLLRNAVCTFVCHIDVFSARTH